MRQSSFIQRITLAIAIGGAFSPLPLPAFAQDEAEIVVHGQAGRRGGADPNERVTRHVPVSIGDLNLRSDADVAMLRQRVNEAAASACDQVRDEIPTMNGAAHQDCVEEARREGMREVSRIVDRARS